MKPNELRIGNMVNLKNCNQVNIIAINDSQISYWNDGYNDIYENIDHFEPIPITEEWLKKCGFDENFATINLINFYEVYFERYENDIYLMTTNNPNEYTIKIDYVHQLQNIYFTLTGNEISIN